MSDQRIGWLGTGRTGTAMATRLLHAGHDDMTVWNRTASKTGQLVSAGAEPVDRIADLATWDITPKILVDCSTVSQDASHEIRRAAADLGAAMLSAPISGNPAMVAAGKAALAVSGPQDAFDDARPLLECSAATFLDFIDGSVMASTFVTEKGKAIRTRDYTPTFTLENQRKDFDLGMAAARTLEVPMPLAASTYQLIQTGIGRGFRNDDYVTLCEVAAQSAGIDHRDEDA